MCLRQLNIVQNISSLNDLFCHHGWVDHRHFENSHFKGDHVGQENKLKTLFKTSVRGVCVSVVEPLSLLCAFICTFPAGCESNAQQ